LWRGCSRRRRRVAEVRTSPRAVASPATAAAPTAPTSPTSAAAPMPPTSPGSKDPVLDLLLDPAWLSSTVGRPVRATRVRSKPGVSHAAALLPTGRAFLTDIHSLGGPTAAAPSTGRAFLTDIHRP